MGKIDEFVKDLNEGEMSIDRLFEKYKIPLSKLKNTREYKKVRYYMSEEDSLEYALNRNVAKIKKSIKN